MGKGRSLTGGLASKLSLLTGGVLLLAVLALTTGPYQASLDQLWDALLRYAGFSAAAPSAVDTVLFSVRIPRVAAGLLTGAALAAAGAVYQGLFRNPLVSPDILGVSAGAGLGAALSLGDLGVIALFANHEQATLPLQIYRLMGDLALADPSTAGEGRHNAEKHYRAAVRSARGRQTKSLELRAACDLGVLWSEVGRRREAKDLIAGIYNWFGEGFETHDLVRARRLLENLSRDSPRSLEH